MYKKMTQEEFSKIFESVLEEVFKDDVVTETTGTFISDDMVIHMSRKGYDDLKNEIIIKSLKDER